MSRKSLLMALLIGAFAVAISAGSPLAKEVGVTDTSILIGSSAGLSGPIANWGNNLSRFSPQAYFNMVNERGGIHGRQIKYLVYDDAYKPDRAMANVKKLIERDRVFCLLLQMGTPTNMATYKYVTEVKKVPLMFPATGAHIWAEPFKKYIFPLTPTYHQQAYVLTDYFVITRGYTKIGNFFQDDDYGYDVRNPTVTRLKAHGLKPVGEEKYKSGQVDVSAQVTKLRQAGAEAVVLGTVYIAGSQFLREARKMGWKVQAGGISPTGLQKMIDLSGDAAPGFVNVLTIPEAEHTPGPAMEEYRRVLKKYYPTAPYDATTLIGWVASKILVEILERTGRDLTRENMIAAGETLKNYDTGIVAPFSTSSTDHSGATAGFMNVVRDTGGGKLRFVPIGADMEKGTAATPIWISSWARSPDEVRPEFEALKKYPQK
jgi:ABC-type branched-subunit amino acid transport system substrate-binding protein